jgi:hypothetical protein
MREGYKKKFLTKSFTSWGGRASRWHEGQPSGIVMICVYENVSEVMNLPLFGAWFLNVSAKLEAICCSNIERQECIAGRRYLSGQSQVAS